MLGITKKQAHIIAAHGYKIVGASALKQDELFDIDTVNTDGIYLLSEDKRTGLNIDFEDIGVYYHILCLPHEALTKEVNGVVPIEIIKESLNLPESFLTYANDFIRSLNDFYFTKDFSDVLRFDTVVNIQDFLHSTHFPPHGIPTECLKFKEV